MVTANIRVSILVHSLRNRPKVIKMKFIESVQVSCLRSSLYPFLLPFVNNYKVGRIYMQFNLKFFI